MCVCATMCNVPLSFFYFADIARFSYLPRFVESWSESERVAWFVQIRMQTSSECKKDCTSTFFTLSSSIRVCVCVDCRLSPICIHIPINVWLVHLGELFWLRKMFHSFLFFVFLSFPNSFSLATLCTSIVTLLQHVDCRFGAHGAICYIIMKINIVYGKR